VVLTVPTAAPNAISTTVELEITEPLQIERVPEPTTTASEVYHNDTKEYGAEFAFDGDMGTRWATDDATKQAWVAIEFPKLETVNEVHIAEAYPGRVRQFALQYFDGQRWETIFNGTTIGTDFEKSFPTVTARQFRLNVFDAAVGPTINEIELTKK